MGVPSNAAAYAHLAGRTARQNTPGECTVLCWPFEVFKLVSIAETLGLNQWKCLDDFDKNSNVSSNDDNEGEGHEETNLTSSKVAPSNPVAGTDGDWNLVALTKTAIRSKTVPELRTFLESKGIPTKGLLKGALVDSVLEVKEKMEPTGT